MLVAAGAAFASAAIETSFDTDATIPVPLTLSDTYTVSVAKGRTITYSGVLSGTGALKITGGGTVELKGANTYTGGTTIESGFLRVYNNASLGTGALTILGQTAGYSGPCELDIMGAGSNDVSVLTIANPIRITGNTTPAYPGLMSFGQNSVLTGKITAAQDFYFYDDTQSTKAIWGSQYNRYTKVTSLTFGEIDCAGTLGNRGFVMFVFGGKVKAQFFDLAFTRPLQRTGDENIANNAHSSFIFTQPSEIGLISNFNHHVYCGCANALPGCVWAQGAPPKGFAGASYLYVNRYGKSTYYDQTLAALAGDAVRDSDVSGFGVQGGDGGKTLTLTGIPFAPGETVKEAVGSIKLMNKMNLVLDAPAGFTQTLLNRGHTLSGSIAVKGGTLRIAGQGSFSNAVSVAVSAGAALRHESDVKDAFNGLTTLDVQGTLDASKAHPDAFNSTGKTALSLGASAALSLPETATFRVKSYKVNGVSRAPGVYLGDPSAPLRSGTVICLDSKGEVPVAGELSGGQVVSEPFVSLGDRTWALAAGEHLVFDSSVRILQGTATVKSPQDKANPAWVEFRGTNTIEGALVSTAAVVSVSGLLATPRHESQGSAQDRGGSTITVDGYPGGGYLFVSNAVIEKPVWVHYNGFGAIRSVPGTTNVLKGHVSWPTPWPGFTAAADSEIVFEGGFKSGHTLRTNGGGTIRIRTTPVTATKSVGWNIGAGRVALDVAGSKFSYLCVGHQNGSVSALGFGASDAFDTSAQAALLNGYFWNDTDGGHFMPLTSGSGTIDLGATVQRVNTLCGSVLSTVRGDSGACLEVLDQAHDADIRDEHLFFASRLEGDVSIRMRGTGTLLLAGRTFETTGSLRVDAGAVEIAEGAAWHGTGGVELHGDGRLVLHDSDQLDGGTRLRLYDASSVEIPAGKTLTVKSVDVWEGAGWIRFTSAGELTAASSAALAGRITGGGTLAVTGTGGEEPSAGTAFPLEWNTTYDTAVPYEVEVDTEKLRRLGGVPPGTGFAVDAAVGGEVRPLGLSCFPGRRPGRVALRFAVPAGTTALTGRAGVGALELEDPSDVGNLFAGALGASAQWTLPATVTRENRADGILFSGTTVVSSRYADYSVAVPADWRGRPVRLEIDATSLSVLPWGGYIRLWQYDADGKQLPESVSDIRWTSHMRPPGKLAPYRENGRIHPLAATVRARFEIRGVDTGYDNYGEPLANAADGLPHLLVSRLVLRKAAELPFPKYDDAFFPAGASGTAGDTALALGGENHNGFFYATHSHAVWSENTELRHERQKFFPTGDGTVEAWFRPSSWAAKPVYLFVGFQGYSAKKSANGRGELVVLKYDSAKSRLDFTLKDRSNTVYACSATRTLPVGKWTHLAVQWAAEGQAAVFVDGTRAASTDITGFQPVDTETEKYANEEMVTEFYLGCHSKSARDIEAAESASYPLFQGAVDLLRVSTGARYAADFTPSESFALDATTRALFTFDRTFDGRSGGDFDFIRGSIRSFADRVRHTLTLGGAEVDYWPPDILPENDHRLVLDIDNYPVLPTAEEFLSARTSRSESRELAPGGSFALTVPEKVYRDYIEIANTGRSALVHPIVLNEGEIDPRSFGDIRETLGLEGLSDRDCANRIFQFVLGASDYFMNHTAFFTPGTDTPGDVEYQALTMLNGYCGFECGPLNNMTKNIFTCSGGLLASQTGGYGHSFEQVFYDGKNHIYDLSAQKFFPAMDNETAAYLEEAADQPGLFHRIGASPDHFIRKATRSPDASSPSYRERVAMNLSPGESLRIWFDNDGEANDLQCAKSQVNDNTDLYKENYDGRCHATAGSAGSVWRVHRYFPHYGNGFLRYEGAVDRANPAFAASTASAAVYAVRSCYPVTAGEYAAKLKAGGYARVQISTDRGVSWRDLPEGRVRYEVRGRTEYLVRAAAKPADIARFTAVTEVQVNARIAPGRLHGGANRFTLKADSGESARVTVGWREPAKRIEIEGGAYSGTIPGSERQLVTLDPSETRVLGVTGASAAATVRAYGGLGARLEGGRLTLSAGTAKRGFAAVDIEDGDAVKQLTVLVCAGARLLTPGAGLTASGTTTVLEADAGRVQRCLNFTDSGSKAAAAFDELPAGRYVVMGLSRFESHPPQGMGSPSVQVTVPNCGSAVTLCYPANGTCHYLKANYGRAGAGNRAGFMWGHPMSEEGNNYYSGQMRVYDVPEAFSSLSLKCLNTWSNGVEVAAVLVVPCDRAGESEELYCDLVKVLAGLNCQPWRVSPGTVAGRGELTLRPTFCSCSVDWEFAGQVDGLAIEYRRAGGTGAWSRAPRFPYFADVGEYRGSILDLEEDTPYDVRLVSAGGAAWATGSFRTWRTDVPVAKTVVLDPKTAEFPIRIAEKGSPDGWVRYTLPEGTALTNDSASASTFAVSGAECVLFDDMRLVGGARYVFELADSTGVRIRNCDISGWGRTGSPRYDVAEGGKRYVKPTDKSAINYDCAIRIGAGMKETVVERCWVHDPRGRANSWYYSHPAGPEAVMMYSPDHSTVIRYNDFCGGNEHRYNDVVEGYNNFAPTGGFNRDADIYGNYMGFSNDDAIELDGGMRNVRCFDNRFERNYCGVSIQGCMVSPVYVYRNAFTGMRDEFDLAGQTIKTSTSSTGPDAWSYIWDNLMWGGGSGTSINAAMTSWHMDVTGNVFCAKQSLSKADQATARSVTSPNFRADPTEPQLDPSQPARPLPFLTDRIVFNGVRVTSGGASVGPAGAVDIGAAVFRYAGARPLVTRWPFVCTTPVTASTNLVQIYDLRQDLAFTAGVSSGPLPFVKTGPGALVMAGTSDSTAFSFGMSQPGSGYPAPAGQFNRFALPDDGTLPTEGFGMFSILEGRMALDRGKMTVRGARGYAFFGGWTAAEGEAERDVVFEQNGGTATVSARIYLGQSHGIADYNTPNGPARAWIVVNGGVFQQAGGVPFGLGSYSNPPKNKSFNSDLRVIVNTNGVFTLGTSAAGTRIMPNAGQTARITVNGGRFQSYLVQSAMPSIAANPSTRSDIEVLNGGTFLCEAFTNNMYNRAVSPPLAVRVADGGRFLVDDFTNVRGQLDMLVDGGVLGDADVNAMGAFARRHLVPANCTSFRVGPKGMTVRATGSCRGGPVTCVIGAPIASAQGPIRVEAAPGNRVEFADGSVFDGPLAVTGGSLRIPAGMTVELDDVSASALEGLELDGTLKVSVPEGGSTTLKAAVTGRGTLVKSGPGELRIASRVEADVLEARDGLVVVDTPMNAVRLVRFGRGSVKLGADEALSMAALEWTDPDAALETCAYLDLNGHVNSNNVLKSVQPTDPDGRFWVKNSGASLNWAVCNTAPGTNTVWLATDKKVNFCTRRVSVTGTRGVQVLSNLVVRANATFACQGYVVAGEVHFPNMTSLAMNNGAETTFDFSNESPDAFPALKKLVIDSHTIRMNDRALASFNAIRRRFSLQSKKASSIVLPEGGCWKVATWIEREVSPYVNHPKGTYGPADYKAVYTVRSLKPASARIRVLSSGPGEVVLPDPFQLLIR